MRKWRHAPPMARLEQVGREDGVAITRVVRGKNDSRVKAVVKADKDQRDACVAFARHLVADPDHAGATKADVMAVGLQSGFSNAHLQHAIKEVGL